MQSLLSTPRFPLQHSPAHPALHSEKAFGDPLPPSEDSPVHSTLTDPVILHVGSLQYAVTRAAFATRDLVAEPTLRKRIDTDRLDLATHCTRESAEASSTTLIFRLETHLNKVVI